MNKKISLEQELKIALDNRAFEIQLFWQRSNYFLVLMTALGIGTFTIKDIYLAPVISAFAVMCSIFWFKVAVGSKFWQESWEVEVSELSRAYGVRSFEKSTAEVIKQVKDSLESAQQGQKANLLRSWVNRKTIEKPSVTYHMIMLALCSVVVWLFVLGTCLARLFFHLCEISAGCLRCTAPW